MRTAGVVWRYVSQVHGNSNHHEDKTDQDRERWRARYAVSLIFYCM